MKFPKFLRIAMNATTEYYKNNGTLVPYLVFDETFEKLTQVFAQALGFSYQLLPPKDGEIGTKQSDGNWTGVIGMVHRNEADFAITSLFLSLDRAEVVDFSYPYEVTKFSFATRKPEYRPKFAAFLDPFNLDVWFVIISLLLIMPILLYGFYEKRYPLQKLFWSTFSSCVAQSLCLEPKKIEHYFLIIFWLRGVAFLIYSYAAVFLAFLTFPPLSGVRTVPELALAITKGDYRCVTYHGSLVSVALSRSSDPNLKIIGYNLLENKGTNNLYETLKNRQPIKQVAFVGIEAHLLIWEDVFFYSGDVIYPMLTAAAMRKDFCCKEQFNRVVFYVWEAGFFRKLVNDRIYHHKIENFMENLTSTPEIKERAISLEHLKGAFAFLAVGYLISSIVLLCEIFGGKLL